MSIRIKSVCLNQPSDSFLYISSFCPPLYSRSTPPRKIFFREILRLSSSKVRHIYYIGLYNIILHLQDQVKYHICQKQTFFTVWCQSLSLVGETPPSAPDGTATSPFRGGCGDLICHIKKLQADYCRHSILFIPFFLSVAFSILLMFILSFIFTFIFFHNTILFPYKPFIFLFDLLLHIFSCFKLMFIYIIH